MLFLIRGAVAPFTAFLYAEFGIRTTRKALEYLRNEAAVKKSAALDVVGTPNIFGSEDNNWFTNASSNSGFYQKRYQDLDFTSVPGKYQTNLTKFGYLASFDINGDPLPITPLANILQGEPSASITTSSVVVVGAPYHFYFGLNSGKTALNRFYKLYVPTEEE